MLLNRTLLIPLTFVLVSLNSFAVSELPYESLCNSFLIRPTLSFILETKPGFLSLLCEIRSAFLICNLSCKTLKLKEKCVTGTDKAWKKFEKCVFLTSSSSGRALLRSHSAAAELITSEWTKREWKKCLITHCENQITAQNKTFKPAVWMKSCST